MTTRNAMRITLLPVLLLTACRAVAVLSPLDAIEKDIKSEYRARHTRALMKS